MDKLMDYIRKNKISSLLLFCIIICTLLLFVVDKVDDHKVKSTLLELKTYDYDRIQISMGDETDPVEMNVNDSSEVLKSLLDFEWTIYRSKVFEDPLKEHISIILYVDQRQYLIQIISKEIIRLAYEEGKNLKQYYLEVKWKDHVYDEMIMIFEHIAKNPNK
ncbi:MAG: hypothetical protein JXR88_00940 [Clostridia bacterium]|nr:hypothetical protein [Clostridia bacterium]